MGAIFGFSGAPDENIRKRMAGVLSHRGNFPPLYSETKEGTLGYIPHLEENKRKTLGAGLYVENCSAIVMAGQIRYPALATELLPHILKKFQEEGPGFVARLRGSFVMAIRIKNALHLVRDGAGVRTVYFGSHKNRFLFAVEPKGILAFPGFPKNLRPGAVAQYLTFSFIPGYQTMLEDLFELPAGHIVTWNGGGKPEINRYFLFEKEEKEERPEEFWIDSFRNILQESVQEQLPDNEAVGLFLSGGIDSSVVAVEAAAQSTNALKTFAIHFGKNYPNELEYAAQVASRLKTEHEEVEITPEDFLPRLRKMIWHLDEPIGDPITMPNFELSARVSSEIRWVFNGEGGDPLFGGPKNLTMLMHHWYGGVERDQFFRERMYLTSYQRCYEELPRLLTENWQKRYSSQNELEGILQPYFNCSRPEALLDKLMAINLRLKGAHLILPKVERMTGAWGLVSLSPLFDERLIRLSFQMPPTLKLARGIEKVVMKKAYQNLLPASVINRPKSGMRVPVHFWFQGEMQSYAKKILAPKSLSEAGIFNPDRVQQLLEYNTEEGPGRYGLRLWMLLTFEIWRRIVIEGEAI
ncbi:asparagine synthetase B family protein [Candidatus Riflebacteria bacterium]